MSEGESVSIFTLLVLATIGALSITNVAIAISVLRVRKEVECICAKAKENLDQAKEISRKNSALRQAIERLARRRKDIQG